MSLLPNGVDDSGYIKWLRNLEERIKGEYARVKNVNKEQLKSALNEVAKAIETLQTDTAKKAAEAYMQTMEDTLSADKPKYSLYKNLFNITGDKGTSLRMSGLTTDGFKTQIDEYRALINDYLKTQTKSKLTVDDLLGFSTADFKANAIPDKIKSFVNELQNFLS